MKKYIKVFIILAIVIIALLVVNIFYINVNGSFLREYIEENELIEITITKETIIGDVIKEVQLDELQIEELKNLFNNTTFRRTFSSTIQFTDKDTYIITGKNADGKQYLKLEAQGQEFIKIHLTNEIDKPFHKTLLVNNGKWKTMIEDIIAD